ncbi:MAG: hypothetical protein MJZ26_03715 [Fibrobacter sp.]|nr:hypothetical protein [Fibrobacter sp.]
MVAKLLPKVEMNCMEKTFLLLTQNMIGNFATSEWAKYDVPAYLPFYKVNKFLRGIRRLWMQFHIPFVSVWYSKKWVELAKKSDVIIVHMTRMTLDLPLYINKLNPKAKVIAWYWNIVNSSTNPKKVKGNCEFWSFDPNDCLKYGMKFNHQYYFKTLVKNTKETEQDVFFCGSDSGRGETLVSLYNEFTKMGLRCLFRIVYPLHQGIPESLKSKSVDYNELLEQNVKSKALLEVVRPGQVGATARQMESLFLQKKLITNNESAANESFYNENNVFILGKRELKDLKDFVLSPYDHSSDMFIEQYDFASWLKNFLEDK